MAQFVPGYRSSRPAHPGRGFGGREQVHNNWTAISGRVPDLSAGRVAEATDGATTFTARGVIVLQIPTTA